MSRRSGRGPARWPHAALALVLALTLAPRAEARVQSVALALYSETAASKDFDMFGFLAGGTAEFDVQFRDRSTAGASAGGEPMSAYVFGCEDMDMYNYQIQVAQTCSQIAAGPNSTVMQRCLVVKVSDQEFTREVVEVDRKVFMTWSVLMCGEGAGRITIDYTFMNPGGEHLGTGYIPLPMMYRLFTISWCALLVAHTYFCFAYHSDKVTALHRMMIALPLLKITYEAASMLRWQTMSKYGYLPNWVLMSHFACSAANQAATFGILILVARGWLITRRTLPVGERQTTTTLVLLLFVLNFAYRYSSFNNMTFFALAITYMTILAIILSNIARNVRELKMQLMILRQADIDPVSTPAHTKTEMFRKFQLYMFSFVCTRVFLEMVLLFLHQHPWIGHLFNETLDAALCVAVAHAFRLREPNPFNTELGEFSWLPMDPMDLLPQNGDAMQLVARMAELGVQINIPPSAIYETYIQKAAMPGSAPVVMRYDNSGCEDIPLAGGYVVVVENPPMIRDGELVENIAMAARVAVAPAASIEAASVPERGGGEERGGALEMILVDPRDARGAGEEDPGAQHPPGSPAPPRGET